MPRPLSIAFIAGLCLALTARADDKLPPGMKPILDKAVRDVERNREVFDKANKKPFEEARKALEALSTKLIKDGKASDAGVVLKQIETLEADVMKMANAPHRPPQKPLQARLLGNWQRGNGEKYVVQQNGANLQVTQSDGNQATLAMISPDVAELSWKTGDKWHLQAVDEDLVAVPLVQDGKGNRLDGIVLIRIK